MKKQSREAIKKYFEANLLDGDKVNDCGGAMLSAKEVWNFINTDIISLVEKECREEFMTKIENKLYDQIAYKIGPDEWDKVHHLLTQS